MSKIVHTNSSRKAQDESIPGDILNSFAADKNVSITTTTKVNCQTAGLLYRSISDPRNLITTAVPSQPALPIVVDTETTVP